MTSIVAEFGLGGDFPRDVIDTLFVEADTDGDGKINLDGAFVFILVHGLMVQSPFFSEFVAAMQ